MKIISILTTFILAGVFCQAQNFFYIGDKNVTEKSIRQELVKASQYVTKSPLASDYIITATVVIQPGTNVLNLAMNVQDSVTYKTLFQSKENYTIHSCDVHTSIFLRMTIEGFIEKNISQIIVCAQDDHYNLHGKFLKARKDKI